MGNIFLGKSYPICGREIRPRSFSKLKISKLKIFKQCVFIVCQSLGLPNYTETTETTCIYLKTFS